MNQKNRTVLLSLMILTQIAFAKDGLAVRPAGTQDATLVGLWEGKETAKDECSAYEWRTERTANGNYHLRYFDDNRTLLDDKGYWWVDERGLYHEFSTDTQEEAAVYDYKVQQNAQIKFSNLAASAEESACNPEVFIEKKIGVSNESVATKN